MLDQSGDLIRLVCKVNWPARNLAGTFQKTVGRSLEPSTRYRMPAFPISLLRDAQGFRDFCEPHLAALRTQVHEPWEFRFDIECDNQIICDSLPGLTDSPIAGPYDPTRLSDAATEIRQYADLYWTFYIQTAQTENVLVFKYTGMRVNALRDIYKWSWGIKDEDWSDLRLVDERLREMHNTLAGERLEAGDHEAAAEHSKVAFDLSPTEEIANDVMQSFAPVVPHWGAIATIKENTVQRMANVAREGVVEHFTLLTERYYREGSIVPITIETQRQLESGVYEERRRDIRTSSATNPYRRGLELAEKVEADMGPVVAALAGTLTEWPLEELRKRVTSSVITRLERTSYWFPDTRMQKLASMNGANIPRVPFTGEVMPYMDTIGSKLDGDLPGILTYAFSQIPDNED